MSLTVAIRHDALSDPELRQRWQDLAIEAEVPFALPEWHEAWLRTHPLDESFVLVAREADGEVIGVVPLVRRGRRARKRLVLAGEQTGDWFGPACAPADEERVSRAVARELGRTQRGWDVFEMDRAREGSGWLRGMTEGSNRVSVVENRGEDTLIAVNIAEKGPELLPGKRRRENDRLYRRLSAEHEVTVRDSTPETAEADFDALLRLRTATWGEGFDPATDAFQRQFAAAMATTGLMRMSVMEIDGEIAAILYGWRLGSTRFAYMQAFERQWERHGVGMWLLVNSVRWAHEEGCGSFDMMRGDEGHKRHFQADKVEVVCHRVVRRASLGRIEAEAYVQARAAYKRLTPERRERLRKALRIS